MLAAFIYFTIIAFMCSIVGHVMSNILIYEDILNWYGRLIGKLPEWLGKPLGICSICFTGQLAIWSSLVYCVMNKGGFLFVPYTICMAVFLVSKYKS